jgi:hypothetical protein
MTEEPEGERIEHHMPWWLVVGASLFIGVTLRIRLLEGKGYTPGQIFTAPLVWRVISHSCIVTLIVWGGFKLFTERNRQ